ncbi:hypothetical protein CVT25_010534 [Psilocybe cyanescens]|uniref:Mid2 domain-containing protein n=1 Tax=Psilocybe cyanescens TaxID=93625 RepID=A0A409XGS8_PSICY|nr:hypothetical protein CVT25_010534 [Psilocybe cyanescens]
MLPPPNPRTLTLSIITTLLFLLNLVDALIITVQPQTLVGTPTLVAWNVEPSDADVQVPASSDLVFDLRFVQDVGDVGLAIADVQPAEGEDAGTTLVTFPSAGTQTSTSTSTSSPRQADQTQTSSPTSHRMLFHSRPLSRVRSHSVLQFAFNSLLFPNQTTPSIPLPSHPRKPTSQTFIIIKNIPAIVGGTTGGLLLLALIAVMFVFVARRRRKRMEREARGGTFHRDMMVQRMSPINHLPVYLASVCKLYSALTASSVLGQPQIDSSLGFDNIGPDNIAVLEHCLEKFPTTTHSGNVI